MESPRITYKYYSNPAFCAQSEVVFSGGGPRVSPRVSNSVAAISSNQRIRTDISDNPLRIGQAKHDGPLRYVNSNNRSIDQPPVPGPKPSKTPNVYKARRGLVRSGSVPSGLKRGEDIEMKDMRHKACLPRGAKERASERNPRARRNEASNTNLRSLHYVESRSTECLDSAEYYQERNMNVFNAKSIIYNDVSESDDNGVCDNNNSREIKLVNTLKANISGLRSTDLESLSDVKSIKVSKHRYAEIVDDFADYSPTKKRIVEAEVNEYNVDAPSEDEFREVPTEIIRTANGKVHRYAIIPSEDEEDEGLTRANTESPPTFHISSPGMSRKTLEATQKLHELLATPKKRIVKIANGSPVHAGFITATPSKRTPIVTSTPKRVSPRVVASPPLPRRNLSSPVGLKNVSLSGQVSPRAQQKLCYDLSPRSTSPRGPDFFVADVSRELEISREWETGYRGQDRRKQAAFGRSTAIISPRLASQRYACEDSAWDDSSLKSPGCAQSPGSAVLALAAAMLALTGGLGAGLALYMMHACGRKYYLDICVLSGFACLTLGLLGLRSRSQQLLPNRNYVSGYIVLSVFSLMTCATLLWLLTSESSSGFLADAAGGALSALGALALALATVGALASCCCRRPPPDNRVADV